MMRHACRILFTLVAAVVVTLPQAIAQENPYHEDGWAKLPDGRRLGATTAISVDGDGNVWIFERCGFTTCADSNLAPVVKFDPTGRFVTAFGAGMFVLPHGMHVDRDGNVWVADANGKDGKGHQVVKFSPSGKVLLTLGKAGVAGDGPDTFNRPSAVTTAPNGDVYIADGHGGDSNARVVKFSKDGSYIKTWGKKGAALGDFDVPHAIATDSRGRVFVGDRSNNRIQIFDPDGNVLAEWKQFGRPSGLFIDANDVLYVADTQSNAKLNPGVKRGIRIGSVSDGKVTAMIPGLGTDPETQRVGEGVAVDAKGNIYSSETGGIRKYVRK